MSKKTWVLWAVLIAVLSSLITGFILRSGQEPSRSSFQETAYDRVMRTKTLRCGYADWPPHVLVKDPTTGKMSGIFVDVTQALAKRLGLKVEWTENTGWGSLIESLRSRRIDAFCAGAFVNAERGLYLSFGKPVFYSAVYPYVRQNDHRFDKDLSIVNNPDIRISAIDGEVSSVVAQERFPKASIVSVPQLGQITDMLINVVMRKADIVFTESSFVNGYIAANPSTLRLARDKPFAVFAVALAFNIHDITLREMFNSAFIELQNYGIIDQIISKYSKDKQDFLRVAPPY